MAHRRATVTIPSGTGVPADAIQNTFHFLTPTPSGVDSTPAELEAIRDALVDFYDGLHSVEPYLPGGGDLRLSLIFHGVTLTPTLTIRIYRCETEIAVGASPEPIITYEVAITPFSTAALPLPTEVAITCSFKGVLDTAIPSARQRGRVYLGPLNVNVSTVVSSHVVVAPGVRATIAAAAAALRDADEAGIDWCVWSGVELGAFPVTQGWVDDAFDTQRRRGTEATTRLLW